MHAKILVKHLYSSLLNTVTNGCNTAWTFHVPYFVSVQVEEYLLTPWLILCSVPPTTACYILIKTSRESSPLATNTIYSLAISVTSTDTMHHLFWSSLLITFSWALYGVMTPMALGTTSESSNSWQISNTSRHSILLYTDLQRRGPNLITASFMVAHLHVVHI